MIMNRNSLKEFGSLKSAEVLLPRYNINVTIENTKSSPIWLHFGAGNIFRGFMAVLQQRLLNEGYTDRGIIAAETFDHEIIDRIYQPFDNLTLNSILNSDATVGLEIIASVTEALKAPDQMSRLTQVFSAPTLQMASFTITEKGYALTGAGGELSPIALSDMENGPEKPRHAMGIAAALLYTRYKAGGHAIAMVSMDNCPRNGDLLGSAITTMAKAWEERGFVDAGFLAYISDANKVSFPWSMIDKITPRPSEKVEAMLTEKGIQGMSPIITSKNTYIAPFVNAEAPQYLVIEDSFPNGRPPLEKAGVYMTDKDTVGKTERMKVATCLNPLHTAMSMYGCLLGYTLISEEMKDAHIVELIRRLGYIEGLPVVTDPGIISPKAFIDEVIEERLPNPFMPDDPRRIATDTSQKVGIRFGGTIARYLAEGRDLGQLVSIPLAIAGWFRYLLAVDDSGATINVSDDPLKEELQSALSGILWNDPDSYSGQILGILSNRSIFGTDLTQTILAGKIEEMFLSLLAGPGAVRATLEKYL